MPRHARPDHRPARPPRTGPSQRQLRAGEVVRHALVEALREEGPNDPALEGVSVTVAEVRMSVDLKHATVFVEPLGGDHADEVIAALNRSARFLRGRLGQRIVLRFTPELRFRHDDSFTEAERMTRLFHDPKVARDLDPDDGA
jgi:ribosome-binding factor A